MIKQNDKTDQNVEVHYYPSENEGGAAAWFWLTWVCVERERWEVWKEEVFGTGRLADSVFGLLEIEVFCTAPEALCSVGPEGKPLL